MNDNMLPLGLELHLGPQFFTQQPIALHRRSDERMNSNRWLSRPRPPLHGVTAELLKRNLWQQFYEQNTEMIITKSGRRMFPSVEINVSGLQKCEKYFVLMEIAPVTERRHKYCGYENGNKSGNMGGWSFSGPAEPQHPFDRRIYLHPDSPATGDHWMAKPINFNKLKLTNNINDNNSNVILTSMHKYIPTFWIIRCASAKDFNVLFSYPAASFIFKETEFIAVTAYQNENITKLKIDNNPFAKGFRKTGQARFKRKYQQTDHQAQSGVSTDRSSRADDEESDPYSDSESSHAASEPAANSLENLTQESAKRLAIENNADNDARDVNRQLVPIAANPSSSSKIESDQMPLHRPWLDPPSRSQKIPSVPSSSPFTPILPPFYNTNLPPHYFWYAPYMPPPHTNCMSFHEYQFSNYFYRFVNL